VTHIVLTKQFSPPALPAPGGAYSAQGQSQFNNVLRLYFNQLNNVLGPLINAANTNNFAAIETVTGDYTATIFDSTILCDATSASLTVTLPAASGLAGRLFNIKKIDSTTNTVTIAPSGADTVDGDTSAIIELQWVNVVVHSDGANWYIL
jgi:hypothetical protein